jgi:ATP-dependent DNA ligase
MEPALVRPPTRRPRFGKTHDIAFEPKWDGFRCIAFRGDAAVDLQTRRGRMLTASFAEVTAALGAQLEPGTVLDGELVVWNGSRLHYGALQARLGEPVWPQRPGRHAPAGYVVFDLLAEAGEDMRARPYAERRARLEQLAERLVAPLFLTESTTDPARARSWYRRYPAAGIEGLVLKPVAGAYHPGEACWDQIRHRRTVLGVVAGVVGTPAHPAAVVVGRPDQLGRLRVAGATRTLLDEVQQQLGARLQPAGTDHPWRPDPLPGSWVGRLSSAERVSYLRVAPTVVAEIAVDAAWNPERWRHLGDLVRLRLDLAPADLRPAAGAGSAQVAGPDIAAGSGSERPAGDDDGHAAGGGRGGGRRGAAGDAVRLPSVGDL